MYGNLVYFLEITTSTQFFKKSVELLGCYRNCDIFFPFSILISIYHSLITPYLRYGVIVWGQASKSQLNKLLVLQKLALRFIHFAKPRDYPISLFFNTKTLPIKFLYYQLLAETMSDLRKNVVPINIQELFLPLPCVHSYGTRSSTSQNFYIKKKIES